MLMRPLVSIMAFVTMPAPAQVDPGNPQRRGHGVLLQPVGSSLRPCRDDGAASGTPARPCNYAQPRADMSGAGRTASLEAMRSTRDCFGLRRTCPLDSPFPAAGDMDAQRGDGGWPRHDRGLAGALSRSRGACPIAGAD